MTPDPPPVSPKEIEAIQKRFEQSYPVGVTDIRHDGSPVYTQMGDPVADVGALLAARAADALRHQQAIETKNDELAEALKQAEWYRERMAEANDGMTYMKAALSTAEANREAGTVKDAACIKRLDAEIANSEATITSLREWVINLAAGQSHLCSEFTQPDPRRCGTCQGCYAAEAWETIASLTAERDNAIADREIAKREASTAVVSFARAASERTDAQIETNTLRAERDRLHAALEYAGGYLEAQLEVADYMSTAMWIDQAECLRRRLKSDMAPASSGQE